MHIGIDGYEANTPNLVGVGTFAYEVICHLYEIDKKNSYTIFLPNQPLIHLPKPRENWHYKVIPSKGLWTFTSLPYGIWSNKEKLDIFFSPTHYIPRFVTVPRIVSAMDLSYLHYPNMFRPKDLYQLKNWTAYSIMHAKKIITISKFTKSEIMKYYSVSDQNIIVAYPGYNKGKFKVKKEILDKYHIKDDYLLFVGTLQPRKNIIKLIEAYSLASQGQALQKINLVIVGKKGWLYKEIFQKVKKLGVEDKIVFLNFVPDEDMPTLYSAAKFFILPSLHEGFGIPVIEAMACGTPTIISNGSSLIEVAGNASIYIDPNSVDSIAEGIKKAIALDKVQREQLIDLGLKNIKRFDWNVSARKVLEVLESVAKSSS